MSRKNSGIAPQATASNVLYDAYSVREYESRGEKKADWVRVGAAFPHSDGKGFNVLLQAVPLDGKMVLRLREPSEDATS